MDRIPTLRRFRFNVVDRCAILAKSEEQSKEDRAIYRAIAISCCPKGWVYVDEEVEEKSEVVDPCGVEWVHKALWR